MSAGAGTGRSVRLYHDAMTAAIPDDYGIPLGGPSELQRAWQMMAGGAPEIVSILMDITRNSPQDSTRVSAGATLLKMAGFGQSPDVIVVPSRFDPAVNGGDGKDPVGKRLEARWAMLREADQPEEPTEDEDGIIDAVIVEDDTE